MASYENAPAHCSGVMVEFHLEIGRAHARSLPGAFLRARGKTGWPKRHPSEKSQPKCTKRNGDADLATQSQKYGKPERNQAAADLCHARGDFRISLGNHIECPQDEHEHDNAENKSGHDYFS